MREGVCSRFCKDCVYHVEMTSYAYGYCAYIFLEDKRRPCPAGKGCTVKNKRKKARRAENG